MSKQPPVLTDFPAAIEAVERICFSIDHTFGPQHYFYVHRLRFAYTLMILGKLPNIGRLLEIGSDCVFLRLGLELTGCDECVGSSFSDTGPMSHSAPRGEPFLFLSGDLERDQLPAPDGSFDTILCGEVIEHMPRDPMALLAEISRLLAPGGYLILTTPNVTSYRNINFAMTGGIPSSFYRYRRSGSCDRHNLEYSPSLLKTTITSAGLEIETLETHDCWSAPDPKLVDFMRRHEYDLNLRGDNIFVTARKVGPVVDRYPSELYTD